MIGKVSIYRLLFACFVVILCVHVCAVTNLSIEDKASGVKFCSAVHRRPGQGITHFEELCPPPRSQKSDELASVHVRRPKGNRCESCGGGPVKITVEMCRRKRHARDAPFVEYCVTRGCRIGMCGYRSTPLTYLYKLHSR